MQHRNKVKRDARQRFQFSFGNFREYIRRDETRADKELVSEDAEEGTSIPYCATAEADPRSSDTEWRDDG